MSEKPAANKTATPPLDRRNTGPTYDMFDSLQQARSKAKRSRQERQSPGDDQLQGDAQRDEK